MSLSEFFVSFLPVILLVAALLCGRYPGEAAIARLAASVARRRSRPRAPKSIATPRCILFVQLRASELLARSLATRPPPLQPIL